MMLVSKPGDVIDVQRRMIDWWVSAPAVKVTEGFSESTKISGAPMWPADWTAARINEILATRFRTAETFWITTDMVTLAEHAAQQFAGQPLHITDLPAMAGFALLDRSVHYRDVRGKMTGCVAFTWQNGYENDKAGVEIVYYTDKYDTEDHDMVIIRENLAQADVGWELPQLVLLHRQFIPYGAEHIAHDYDGNEVKDEAHAFVATVWTLMGQELAAKHQMAADRSAVKRARRENLDFSMVTVVMLRRRKNPKGPSDEESSIEWTHRWMVKGHWRNQYLPGSAAHGGPTHRQQWIEAYQKGPEFDAQGNPTQLIIKDKVTKLAR